MPAICHARARDGTRLAYHSVGLGPALVMLFPYHVNDLLLNWAVPAHRQALDDSAEIVAALECLGSEYVPEFEDELPERRYFRRWANGRRSHQVHLVERSNTDWWDRHVGFRDWLRNHDHDRDRYAELKRRLASTHRNDRRAYTDGKSHFIRAIEEKSTPGPAQPSGHGS